MYSPRHQRSGDAALRRGYNGGSLRLAGTAHAAPADLMHSSRRHRRGDAALRHGSNSGMPRLPGTAHAALVGHVLAAPPQTRRRRSAPRLQRRVATTTRHCSRGAGRLCTRRATKEEATPLCAAATTAGRYDYPALLTRRRPIMHSMRRHRRGDAALRRGSNGGMLRIPGTAHAAPVIHALAAPPKTRRPRSAPRLQRWGATNTQYCSRGVGNSCTRRAATDATTPLCAAAPTAGRYDYAALLTRRW